MRNIRRPSLLTLTVFTLGFIVTASAVLAANEVDDSTEQRLLERQTRQAAAVLSSAVLVNQQPLDNALTVQPAAGVDAALFRKSMSEAVGADKAFISASIWQRQGGRKIGHADAAVRTDRVAFQLNMARPRRSTPDRSRLAASRSRLVASSISGAPTEG